MPFERDGYDIRAVFSPAELAVLHEDVTAHIDRVAHALYAPFELSEPRAPFGERIERVARNDPSYANLLRLAVCTDAHNSLAMERIARHPALLRHAAGFVPGPVLLHTSRLRAAVPSLAGPLRSWHSDVALDDGSESADVRLACWIPLMDAGAHGGGLEIAVGRRDAPYAHVRETGGHYTIPEDALIDAMRVQPDCPAGHVIFLDSFTPHREMPAANGRERWSLVVWFRARRAALRALAS